MKWIEKFNETPVRVFKESKGMLEESSYESLNMKKSVGMVLERIFLPEGYPHSVSKDYLEYQFWDSIQALCSTLSGILATRAVLEGVGVGKEHSNVVSAVMNWIIKDGTGMVARVFFASAKSKELDANSKMWRLMADVCNDAAMMVELMLPFFPSQFFLPIVMLSSTMRAIVGVAGSATRTAITEHQARSNNIADVASKDGSQETFVNLLGLLLGLWMAPWVGSNQFWICCLFLVFTALHLFANWKAVSCVVFESLNRQRAFLLVKKFWSFSNPTPQLPNPREIAALEQIFWFGREASMIYDMQLGTSLRNGVKLVPLGQNSFVFEPSGDNEVVLTTKADKMDILEAFFLVSSRLCFKVNPNHSDFVRFCSALKTAGWSYVVQMSDSPYRIEMKE